MSKQISLTRGYVAIVDDEDYEMLNQWNWRVMISKGTAYAIRHQNNGVGKYASVLMHRQIMDPSKGVMVDHRDGNGLNNQRANLRIATYHENARNRQGYRHNKSTKFKGVSWDSARDRWAAYIRIEGKVRNLGRYLDEVKAAKKYDQVARQYFGEFARENFPESEK